MARARITHVVQRTSGDAIANASVTVTNRKTGVTATIYVGETGTSTLSNPITSDSDGRLTGWVDEGSYNLVATDGTSSYTEPLEAVSGSNSGLIVNVKNYGAVGDAVADDYAAIAAAYAAIPAAGGTLYFPPGLYLHGTALSFTDSKPLSIMGAGQMSSRICATFAGGDAITVNGPGLFSMSDISVAPTVNRTAGTYLVAVKNCTRPMISNVYVNAGRGGLFLMESCNFVQMVNCQGDSNDGTHGDTCLRLKGVGGTYSNLYFRTAGGVAPCLWITGSATSMKISNCGFAGGGPHSSFAVTGITSSGASFVVTAPGHDFQAGDFLVLRGCTPAAYNDVWRITSKTSSTVTVTSTANPGVSTVNGTAESLSACGYITNELGPVNESAVSNCLFEAGIPNVYGTVGLYFDGRRGTAGSRAPISGWRVNGNYYDYGDTGLLLSGTTGDGSAAPTVNGITVNGGVFVQHTRGMHIDQANGVTVTGVLANTPGNGIVADSVSQPCGLYIYAGPATPYTQGVTISNSHFGQPRDFQTSPAYAYGIILDAAGTQDLIITGCQIYGTSLAVGEVGSPLAGTNRWKIYNNNLASGALPIAGTNFLPSVTSGTSISLFPYHDVQKITGTNNIQTISSGWVGRHITLIFTGALSLVTGGNLAIGANYAVLVGQAVTLISDGTNWYVK